MRLSFTLLLPLLFWLSGTAYLPLVLLNHNPPENPLLDLPPALFFTLSNKQGKCVLASTKARGLGIWYKKRTDKKFITDLGLFGMDEKKTKYVISTREAPARSMYEGIDTFFVIFNGQLDTLILRVRPPQTGSSSIALAVSLNGFAAKKIEASNDMPTYYQLTYYSKMINSKVITPIAKSSLKKGK